MRAHSADRFRAVDDVIVRAVAAQAFPAAILEVGTSNSPLHRKAFGTLTYDADAPAATEDTIFDLASLTKVISTATLVMRLVEERRIALDDPVARRLPRWRGAKRESVTIRALLGHCSGLSAWLPFFRDHAGRADYEPAICMLPLEYEPWTRAIYSDLGFILLGFIVADAAGRSLEDHWAGVGGRISAAPLSFKPPAIWRSNIAPTERDLWRGRLLVGEVHDENAWALGAVAGHAGLFGTVEAVGDFARAVMRALHDDRERSPLARQDLVQEFITRTSVPGSSRALGWDTMLPTSSCGSRMSTRAFGHTGFTGTSLWIDPDADAYVVFLTNRIHPTRERDTIREVRPAVHDGVMAALRR